MISAIEVLKFSEIYIEQHNKFYSTRKLIDIDDVDIDYIACQTGIQQNVFLSISLAV